MKTTVTHADLKKMLIGARVAKEQKKTTTISERTLRQWVRKVKR